MRKTRKFPNMFGSVRRHKQMRKWQRQAEAFERWHRIAFPKAHCDECVSEPICLNF